MVDPLLPNSSDDDARLLAAVARGDATALAILYDRYASLLMGAAVRIMNDREAAEDLVHDVFMEAWKQAAGYDPSRGAVRTWFMVRLRSRALDRKRSGYTTRESAVADIRVVERPQPLEEDPSLGPDRRRLRHALSSLPEDQRIVLELSYFEGLSSSEIAGRLGVPIGTVKSRVAAAFTRVRTALGAQAEVGHDGR